MSLTITTPDAAALMQDLTHCFGGRYGAQWNKRIAENALAKARENADIVRGFIGTPGYALGRRIAVARLKRCRAAIRKLERELEEFK